MSDERELLRRTAELAADYLDSLGERHDAADWTPEFSRRARALADIDRTVVAFETALATV